MENNIDYLNFSTEEICSSEVHEIISNFDSNETTGLSIEEVEKRLQTYGRNALPEGEEESLVKRFLGQFKEPLILLLLSSAIISILIGEIADAIGIFIAVTIVNFVGFYQELKSEKTVESLKNFEAHYCTVIRGEKTTKVDAKLIVPGDIVAIEVGNRIPADIRIIYSNTLQIG